MTTAIIGTGGLGSAMEWMDGMTDRPACEIAAAFEQKRGRRMAFKLLWEQQ